MNAYNAFNAVEACLWGLVAVVIPFRATCANRQQRMAIVLASVAFVAFGVTDLLELGREGILPLWLWGCKIACGVAILSARYTWLGWNRFRWRDREVLFGLACLVAVGLIILCQRLIYPIPAEEMRSTAGTAAWHGDLDRMEHYPG